MVWFTKKTRRFADAPSLKLRLESLEERQLLTAVGWEGAVANEQIPYGPEFRVEGERAETGAIDLAPMQHEDVSTIVTTSDDVVNPYDDVISLREAIEYATADDNTITFDSSLNGETIKLGGFELVISKSLKIDASDLTDGVIISGNGASRVFYVDNANLETINTTITEGKAENGGGIYVKNSVLTLTNTTLTGNSSSVATDKDSDEFFGGNGGGIYVDGGEVTLMNSIVEGNVSSIRSTGRIQNSAGGNGGGIYVNSGALTLTNTIVAGNSSSFNAEWVWFRFGGSGGGIFINDGDVTLTNSTVADNLSSTIYTGVNDYYGHGGGGIYVTDAATATLCNTIVTNNSANSNLDVSGVYKGECNLIGGDPGFVDATNGNYRLAENSQAIDAGNVVYAAGLATDLAGNPRICGASVDLGAYEYYVEDDASTIVTTSEDVVNKQDGLISLREAITVYAASGDAVSFADSVEKISLTDEIAIDKNLTIDATGVTIDANGGSRIFSVAQGSAVEIDGGTFINGKAGSLESSENGGAIKNAGALTLNGVTFEDNVATKNGGAVFNDVDATLTVDGGFYLGNKARNGGAFANYGAMTISDGTTISNNDVERFGGAYFGCGSLEVGGESTVTFSDNTAGYDKDGNVVFDGAKGGAIYNDVNKSNGSVNLTGNVVFSGNKATERGGAIQTYSTLTIEPEADAKVSFENNSALKYGGAIDVGTNGSATINGKASFTGNTAPGASGVDGFGGAIFSVAALKFKGGTYEFSRNVAAMSGGAIDACAGTLTLAGTFDFSANQARGEYDDGELDDPKTKTGVGGAIATAAKTTVTEGSQFTFAENVAKHGADVAIDTTEEGNQDNVVNAAPDKFGVGVDYATITVMRETLPSPAAPLLPDKFVSNAAWATITVEGATAKFGAEGVAPQQLGLGAGTYDALIQCANADGETCAVYSLVLTVDAGASVEVRETTIADGRGVKFDFNLTKKDGRAVSVWEISWGDGSTSRFENLSRSQTAAHYYAQDGTFDVSLKVVYLDGASETFDAFSTQKIGASIAKTEALSAIFEEVDDLFEDAFVELENPSVYGPAFLR